MDDESVDGPIERANGAGSRMFQIYESDLAELEKIVPAMSDHFMGKLSPRLRTQLRRAKDILSNVRWNYGPHDEVEVIPAE